MTNVFLKPACDAAGAPLLVRDPVTMRPLDADGEWKTKSGYWIRRERDKEVIEASPPGAPAAVEPSPASSVLNLISTSV